jgi:hypothetical protein
VHESDEPHGFVKLKPSQFDNCGPRLGRNVLVIAGIPFRSHLSAQIFQSRVIREQRILDLRPQQSECGTLPGSILDEQRKQKPRSDFVKGFNDAHVKANDAFP